MRGTAASPTVTWVLGLGLAVYVLVYPFTTVRYPPITDLPFHAAHASIFRHYWDPAFHFREQFELHPLEVPYDLMYAVGALSAFVVPIHVAAKIMSVVMLALVPAGLAVLRAGMKKSPAFGLSGLGLVWCTVSQWGFLSYMGAVGLFAMAVGLALLVIDRPTRTRSIALAVTLVLLFFTHVYRTPFAILAVLAAGLLTSRRRLRSLIPPLAPVLALFALWLFVRPEVLGIHLSELGFHLERVREIPKHLFGAYLPLEPAPPTPEGNLERGIAKSMLVVAALLAVASAFFSVAERRRQPASAEEKRLERATTVLVLCIALGLFVTYLTFPYSAGGWFYVYPREIVTAVLFLLAAFPEVPRAPVPRLGILALIAAGTAPMAHFVSKRFSEFEASTLDFQEIQKLVPRAPRLFSLVYFQGGSTKRISPFLHLSAWIQAEKGGALGFHFASWNLFPIRYRSRSPEEVPPPLPPRFEWNPQDFRVMVHGPWFDTFLVRHIIDPSELFQADPSVQLVAHRGTYWLYRRDAPGLGNSSRP